MKPRFYKEDGVYYIAPPVALKNPLEFERFYRSLRGLDLQAFKEICQQLPSAETYAREHQTELGWTDEMLLVAQTFSPQQLKRPVPYFPKPWLCFRNSLEHAQKTGLLYVEGLAINPTGPQIHAWNSSNGNNVFDYTWPDQHLNRYFGLAYNLQALANDWPAEGGIIAYLKKLHGKPQPPG